MTAWPPSSKGKLLRTLGTPGKSGFAAATAAGLEFGNVADVAFGPGGAIARRARLHCRFAPPRVHFIPDSLTYSVPYL